jgi:Cu-Zn family superoxide dismutase
MKAIAVFQNKLSGFVKFHQIGNDIHVLGYVTGLNPNSKHAIHIHEYGDLSDGCSSACSHFNPFNKQHGGRDDKERHVGDLGNITTDKNGESKFKFIDSIISLKNNKRNILGRSVIIHEDPDDLGKGGFKDSLTTGHAGKRLDCAVIGICKN